MIEWWFLALIQPMEHHGKYDYYFPPPIVLSEHPSEASCVAAGNGFIPNLTVTPIAKQQSLVCVMMPVGGHSLDTCRLDPPIMCPAKEWKAK